MSGESAEESDFQRLFFGCRKKEYPDPQCSWLAECGTVQREGKPTPPRGVTLARSDHAPAFRELTKRIYKILLHDPSDTFLFPIPRPFPPLLPSQCNRIRVPEFACYALDIECDDCTMEEVVVRYKEKKTQWAGKVSARGTYERFCMMRLADVTEWMQDQGILPSGDVEDVTMSGHWSVNISGSRQPMGITYCTVNPHSGSFGDKYNWPTTFAGYEQALASWRHFHPPEFFNFGWVVRVGGLTTAKGETTQAEIVD